VHLLIIACFYFVLQASQSCEDAFGILGSFLSNTRVYTIADAVRKLGDWLGMVSALARGLDTSLLSPIAKKRSVDAEPRSRSFGSEPIGRTASTSEPQVSASASASPRSRQDGTVLWLAGWKRAERELRNSGISFPFMDDPLTSQPTQLFSSASITSKTAKISKTRTVVAARRAWFAEHVDPQPSSSSSSSSVSVGASASAVSVALSELVEEEVQDFDSGFDDVSANASDAAEMSSAEFAESVRRLLPSELAAAIVVPE
jgi:hypothetical protein